MCSIKLWIPYLLLLETMWLTSWEGMLRAVCSSSSVRLGPSIVYISIKNRGQDSLEANIKATTNTTTGSERSGELVEATTNKTT